ncbi:MAG: M20/M25/M40 family metallo-hydrolase [Myxococcota bacterium]|nr:M20/M25/M40 family metallo-hydrolase [Myxococcota bacterium]
MTRARRRARAGGLRSASPHCARPAGACHGLLSRGLLASALCLAGLAIGALGASAQPTSHEPGDWSALADEAARLLSDYIRIDTTNPPGRELAGARFLERFLAGEGIEAEIFVSAPERGNLVARLPATDPDPAAGGPILLLSHIDTVPADPTAWSFPPLSGAVEDGWVYGRGAIDDKGHGVVQALALALLVRQGVPRRRDVVLAATAAEEAGGDVGADWLVEHHWEALGPPAVVWNEGGASTRSPLAGDRVVNAIATSEKRSLWMTLRATGEGGHGSQPVADGAVNRIARALDRIQRHPTPLHVTATVGETLDRTAAAVDFPLNLVLRHADNPLVLRLAGPKLTESRVTNAMLRDTISLTGMQAGLKHNVIPRRAEAMLDVRLLPDTDQDDFLAWLRRVIGDPRVEIELNEDVRTYRAWRERVMGDADRMPAESPVDNELFRALEAELAHELPDSLTVPLQTTGGTDSKYFRARGVPAYGYLPALSNEELLDSIHGLDERVPVRELERALRVTFRTLVRLVE